MEFFLRLSQGSVFIKRLRYSCLRPVALLKILASVAQRLLTRPAGDCDRVCVFEPLVDPKITRNSSLLALRFLAEFQSEKESRDKKKCTRCNHHLAASIIEHCVSFACVEKRMLARFALETSRAQACKLFMYMMPPPRQVRRSDRLPRDERVGLAWGCQIGRLPVGDHGRLDRHQR